MTYCAVVGCNNNNDKRRIQNPVNYVEPSFCRFPKDEQLRNLWLYRCGRPNNCTAKRLFVCLKHFKKSDYVRNLRHELLNYYPKTSRKVRFDAVPCLFLPPSVIVPDFELNETPMNMKKVTIPSKQSFEPKPKTKGKADKIVVSTPTQILAMRYCAVVGCNNSNDKIRIQNPVNYVEPSFCQFPRDEQLRKLWLYRCGRQNDCTAKRLFVCLKHFKKSDYERDHPKTSRKIRLDAVPCLFLPPSVIVPDFELNETPMNMKKVTIPSKQSFEPKPKGKADKIVVSTPTQILASTIAPNPTPTLTLTSTPTPITTTFNVSWQNKLSDADRLQSEFIDHVVIAYLNRCRSRAGNPNVGMPGYILKGKAQEAEVLLGARLSDRFNWVERFKPKIAEYDAKGIVLSPVPQSLNVADIISDEWPNFAKEKGLDIGEDSEETISVHEDDEIAAINHDVVSQSQSITPPPPVMEETFEDAPREILEDQDQVEKDKHEEFLRHVMMSFIRRFNATWPHAHIPDIILSAKFREATIILQSNIKNKSIWFREFRNRKNNSPDEFFYNEPNQSLDMADIIEVERCKFNFDYVIALSKKGEPKKGRPKKGIANEKTRLTAKEIEIITSEETRLTAGEIKIINSGETRLTAEEIVTINSEDTTLTANEYEIITEPNQSLDAFIEDIIKEEPPKVIFEDSIKSILEEESEAEEVEDTITSSVLIKGSDLEKVDDSTRPVLVKESEPKEVLQVIDSEAKIIEDETEQSSNLIETYEEALDCLSLLNNYALDLGDFNALTLIRQVDSYLRSDDCK